MATDPAHRGDKVTSIDPANAALVALLTKPLKRPDPDCQKCGDMGGTYVATNGGRTFVPCECREVDERGGNRGD